MRFGNLDFIIMVGGELTLAHATIQSLPSIGLNYERLERQLGVSLGPSRPGRTQATSPSLTPMIWRGSPEENPLSGTPHTKRLDSASIRSPQLRGDR